MNTRTVTLLRIAFCALLLGVVGSAAGQTSPAKPIELRFNSFVPNTHGSWRFMFKPWIEELEKRSRGRVKVIAFHSGALAKQAENYDATVKGLSDMSYGTQRITVGRFSLSELLYLPGLGLPDANSATLALWQIYQTFPEVRKQYDDAYVLVLLGLPPRVIATSKKPVRTLEDLKGLKIWVAGRLAARMIAALGATPVTMASGEVYVALEKGILDGAGWSASSLVGNRIHEHTKYVANIPLDVGTTYFVMNKDVYNRLPADIKKIVTDMGGEWGAKFIGERYNKMEEEAWEVMRKSGVEIIDPPAAEAARWHKAIEPVTETELKALEAKGLPARKVHAELLKFSRQYRK